MYEGDEAFTRMERVMRGVVNVPKDEVDAADQEERERIRAEIVAAGGALLLPDRLD